MWYSTPNASLYAPTETHPRLQAGPTRYELARCAYVEGMRSRRALERRARQQVKWPNWLTAVLALLCGLAAA